MSQQAPVTTALAQGPCPSPSKLGARYLGEFLDKIRHAVQQLDEARVWRRPEVGVNSIGNLLLHLKGNLSMWIGQGLGGRVYERDRAGEFRADSSHGRSELLEGLADTVAHCQWVLEQEDPERLAEIVEIQGHTTDRLGVIFHAVEHMSYHTGQILTLTKQLLGPEHGIEFYPQHANE